MSPYDDDADVDTRRALDDRAVEALLTGHPVEGHEDLQALLTTVRTASAPTAPVPSAALAALLTDGMPVPASAPPVTPRPRRRRVAVPAALALAITGSFGLFAGAAAANQLPARVQTAVADVVESVTPLQVPRPAARVPDSTRRTPGRQDESTPAGPRSERPGARPDATQGPGPRTGQDSREEGEQGRSGDVRQDDRGAEQRSDGTSRDSESERSGRPDSPKATPAPARDKDGESDGSRRDRSASPSADRSGRRRRRRRLRRPLSRPAQTTAYCSSSAASDGPTRADSSVPASRCSSVRTSPSECTRDTSEPSA